MIKTGTLKRYIRFSARLINDIVQYCEDSHKPGAIVCLDFKNASDSLDCNFLFGCLKHYGFGNWFIHWIKILYNKPTFSVKNNGWDSKESQMGRGIRQECAVPALLFILAVEFLAIKIRDAEEIKGIEFFKIEANTICR